MDAGSELRESHTPEAVRRRLESGVEVSYLRDFLYGAIDGAVTTFAIVSGVAGAGLASGIVLILGIANLLADGFSMAASNFTGVRAERQMRSRLRRMEEEHIEAYPEGETEEIREIFRQKGFRDADLERAVEVITSNRKRWVDTMLTEEHGLALQGPSPFRAALVTFVAFVVVGFVPLAPFVFGAAQPYLWSAGMTLLVFFAVGAWKSLFIVEGWFVSGLETLALGGGAAGVAYGVGVLLRDFAGM